MENEYFGCFYLDNEKDMVVVLRASREPVLRLFYTLKTPNHHSGNLIRNFAGVCGLALSTGEGGLLEIRGEVPCYIDANAREIYILRFGGTKVANIYPDGRIERKAAVPAIAKTLMSQTKDYRLPVDKTIFKTYIPRAYKFRTDLHTHMNANLPPDVLIALGIVHQIRYPLYYIRKLGLVLTAEQEQYLSDKREHVAKQFVTSGLTGKYLDRKINDNTFLNFADLILNNPAHAAANIVKIRASLAILKDGQAVFTNLEKVYLYRYVFCKGTESRYRIALHDLDRIPDPDVQRYVRQMLADREDPDFLSNTIYQDLLLWIARQYQSQGITYAEISDTTLVKKYEALQLLTQVHEVMPAITRRTGVRLRFLAAMRRIPLTIVKDKVTPPDYLRQNLDVLQATSLDPYVAGCDIVGEEINDIRELAPMIRELVRIAGGDPDFVIRIHAGENDSLRDNVANSIACVRQALAPGQKMPKMRIGHGLYTVALRSAKGRQLLEELRDLHIVLEFQLTSNVRLNNLNSLDHHPLHEYLRAGVRCVQGTDGAALYGTNNIDEQLSLEKLLDMKPEEMLQMRKAEDVILEDSREAFARKAASFRRLLAGRELTEVLLEKIEQAEQGHREVSSADHPAGRERETLPDHREGVTEAGEGKAAVYAGTNLRAGEDTAAVYTDAGRKSGKDTATVQTGTSPSAGKDTETVHKGINRMPMTEPLHTSRYGMHRRGRYDANTELADMIEELPWDRLPVVVAGGSFNSRERSTRMNEEGIRELDALMKTLDPQDVMFVIGYQLNGYERYILDHNEKGFKVFAFTPAFLTAIQRRRLREAGRKGLRIRVSIESEGMGIYKSFNYEIFERRPSIVIAFDGNSAAENLIQEARNGKGKSAIFIYEKAAALRRKAMSLEGYVHMFGGSGQPPLSTQVAGVNNMQNGPDPLSQFSR